MRVQYKSESLLLTWWMAAGSVPHMLLLALGDLSALLHESCPQAHFTDENTKLNTGFTACPRRHSAGAKTQVWQVQRLILSLPWSLPGPKPSTTNSVCPSTIRT